MAAPPPPRRWIAMLAPLLLAACSTELPAEDRDHASPASAPLSEADIRFHTEPVTRIRFPVISAGVTVGERHYDPTLPARKFRHSIRLATERGTVVLIDVWDNPQRLALGPWFDAHLAFLVGADTRVSERLMTRARVPGILLHEPRSPQALSQAIAVFASGDQVFRVTAIDHEDDAVARRLFDMVVDHLELGVAP